MPSQVLLEDETWNPAAQDRGFSYLDVDLESQAGPAGAKPLCVFSLCKFSCSAPLAQVWIRVGSQAVSSFSVIQGETSDLTWQDTSG